MSASFPPKRAFDTPANDLRQLASRAYRVLRRGCPEDRGEVIALLDEIDRSRRAFDQASSGELLSWFDRLELLVARLLDDECPEDLHDRADCANSQGVGVA